MLTKARELSGAEDRHNGRKEAGSRKRGSLFCHTKYSCLAPLRATIATIPATMREWAMPPATATGEEVILTGGEGGWTRISAPVSLWHPRLSLRQHGGLSRRRSRQERCMTGRDERERAVHCANREGREGHTGPVPLLCVYSLFVWGVFIYVFYFIHIICQWSKKNSLYQNRHSPAWSLFGTEEVTKINY